MVDGLRNDEFLNLSRQLSFLTKESKKVLVERYQAKTTFKKLQQQKSLKDSTIFELLNSLSIEALLYLMAKTPHQPIKKAISNYITRLRFTEALLTGEDLKKMGLPPGRIYKQAFQRLLKARLDGKIKTREDEIGFIKHHFL